MSRGRISGIAAAGCLAASVLLTAGCVSEQTEPEHKPRLMVAQDSDGVTTISWDSEPGYTYYLFYMHPEKHTWTRLENVPGISGTGETITVKDRRRGQAVPWYTIRHVME